MDLTIYNMENVRPTRYVDEAMNDYKIKVSLILNTYIIIIIYYLTSTFATIFVVSNRSI